MMSSELKLVPTWPDQAPAPSSGAPAGIRGGAWSDVLGYRKTDDGYEINFLNQTWDPVAGSLVQGEVATVNGSVLIVSAETDEGPVIFAGDEGVRFAIANFETGPLPGGVFMAGPDIGRDAFRAFLESLEFVAK